MLNLLSKLGELVDIFSDGFEQRIYEKCCEEKFGRRELFGRTKNAVMKGAAAGLGGSFLMNLKSCSRNKKIEKNEPKIKDPWLRYLLNAHEEFLELKQIWDMDPYEEIKKFPMELQEEALKLVRGSTNNLVDNMVLDNKVYAAEEYFSEGLSALNFGIQLVNHYNKVWEIQQLETLYVPGVYGFEEHFEILGINPHSEEYSSHLILSIQNKLLESLQDVIDSILKNESTETLISKVKTLYKKTNNAEFLTDSSFDFLLEPGENKRSKDKEINLPKKLERNYMELSGSFKELFDALYPNELGFFAPIAAFKSFHRKTKALEEFLKNYLTYLGKKVESTFGSVRVLEGSLPLYDEWRLYEKEDFLEKVPEQYIHREGAVLELKTKNGLKRVKLPKNVIYERKEALYGMISYSHSPSDDINLIELYLSWTPALYNLTQGCSRFGKEKIPKSCDEIALWTIADQERKGKMDIIMYEGPKTP